MGIFCAGTKVFEEALNAVKFLDWLKEFGPAQNILGHVKGQDIRAFFSQSNVCTAFYFHSQIELGIHFANKTKLCN